MSRLEMIVMTKQRKKKCLTKNSYSPNLYKTLQIIQHLLWNDQNHQNAQKLKIDQKRQKKLNNTKNCLGMIFMTKYLNKNLFHKNKFFFIKIFSKRLLENDKYGQIAQKLKVG